MIIFLVVIYVNSRKLTPHKLTGSRLCWLVWTGIGNQEICGLQSWSEFAGGYIPIGNRKDNH